MPDRPETTRPRRGRPSLGKPVLVVLGELEVAHAKRLGEGVIAEGVRRALRAVSGMSVAEVAHLAEEGAARPAPTKDGSWACQIL
jgi:hypothetical protein